MLVSVRTNLFDSAVYLWLHSRSTHIITIPDRIQRKTELEEIVNNQYCLQYAL